MRSSQRVSHVDQKVRPIQRASFDLRHHSSSAGTGSGRSSPVRTASAPPCSKNTTARIRTPFPFVFRPAASAFADAVDTMRTICVIGGRDDIAGRGVDDRHSDGDDAAVRPRTARPRLGDDIVFWIVSPAKTGPTIAC